MKPVNLLPERHRPRAATAGPPGGAYTAVGVLGALLVAVALYAVTANQVSSRSDEAARAQREADQAEARVAALSPFGKFAQVKATRVQSVKQLADARIDWERLTRELARVLPAGVSLTELGASTEAEGTPGEDDAAKGPSLELKGCAPSQPSVATMLVRLRRLHLAEDVRLGESSRAEEGSAPAAAGAPGASAPECAAYTFDVTVALAQAPAAGAAKRERVSASLGGGS